MQEADPASRPKDHRLSPPPPPAGLASLLSIAALGTQQDLRGHWSPASWSVWLSGLRGSSGRSLGARGLVGDQTDGGAQAASSSYSDSPGAISRQVLGEHGV